MDHMAEGVEAGCAHVDCTVLVTQENMMGELVFGEVYGRANGVKEGGTGGYEGGVVWFLVWRKGMMGWLVGLRRADQLLLYQTVGQVMWDPFRSWCLLGTGKLE
jgi:hypothetical protein